MNALNKLFNNDRESFQEENLKKYIQAGKIAAKVREEIKRAVKEGMLLIEVCETVEGRIRDLGGKPAFPCNVSVNEVAAHYTSPPNDERRIPEKAIVKIDIGVHVDGYIADTATTACFSPEYEGMVYAAEKALEAAINIVRPGISISKVSSEIQAAIERYGFKPISNLTGHQIGRYIIHAGKSIPNISHFSLEKIASGCVYAIEPFVTLKDAIGIVKDSPERYIFRLVKYKFAQKQTEIRNLLNFINENFKTLPFAERWLIRDLRREEAYKRAFSELISQKYLMSYPVFIEASLKPVAQAEHTIFVGDKDIIVIT
ncbi:type II methionyl aminopeptidase [Candidatus Bathyarchaeota archaeon]|nr:type II methionyl aminopeptidase [Candidatus Bathyarchaeota archaeon]